MADNFPYIPISPGASLSAALTQVQPMAIASPADLSGGFERGFQMAELARSQPARVQTEANQLRQQGMALQGSELDLAAKKAQQPNVLHGIKLQANLMSQLPEGATQFDLQTAQEYHALTGSIKLTQDGQLDLPAMREEVGRVMMQRREAEWLKSAAEAAKVLRAGMASPDVVLKDSRELADSIAAADQHLANIESVEDLAKSEWNVGRAMGSKPGQFAASAVSFFGKHEIANAQDRLKQVLNADILGGASKMKGNLSDKDVQFLTAMYPQLRSNPEVWADYFNRSKIILRQGQANAREQMEAMRTGRPISPPVGVSWGKFGLAEPDLSKAPTGAPEGASQGDVLGTTRLPDGSRVTDKKTGRPGVVRGGVVYAIDKPAAATAAPGSPAPLAGTSLNPVQQQAVDALSSFVGAALHGLLRTKAE